MFAKEIVIDCRGHLLGRLASMIAKELLSGQKIVAVHCEGINISGSLFRNKLKYESFKRKHTNSNPKKGPIHFRAPSKILWRTIRGMIRHKTARGQAALDRLKVFDGMPHPYDKAPKQVIPCALKALRLKPTRKFCCLGDLSERVGWKCKSLVERLTERRNLHKAEYYTKVTKTIRKVRSEAQKQVAADPKLKAELATVAPISF
ncbi:60S ribosomal protein L13A, putative [Perkinsus marinus ATCC 50983]|uniref:60S ribosomal protein L13A, putative n=1 Tax=Perkinsus marinus (strain ATCC 50983 / TXsc) TaxID=423536 RepID=C5K578_PERM5|nr:60S ribosomal protein L13A, putative [Perkinsus marinus ATCC 50983]XP_002788704.1 60S ribosomal protein L13A, putative [Perkinsus marinus ATCC 50983]EER08216.1 60S ribosomal protein L13A, putative [Perkinsus marinus ATCC 50983]EER20500.1 60S ribosomal protein L13A, putative [Perkinsus marinus ATCC 50983]|eukprot:XP_002776400.1 60S ribosomal protein L13A, putative [Perkinsus marinus ATCC 50983]